MSNIYKVIEVLKNPSKLRAIPALITAKVKHSCNINRNYRKFIKSGKTAIIGDLPYDIEVVQKQFAEAGCPPKDYFVDVKDFNEYCYRHKKTYENYKENFKDLFHEKALEHFVSLSFSSLTSESKVIDIAGAGSPFPSILYNDYKCNIWSNDLAFPRGTYKINDWHTQIGGDACHLPVEDDFFDLAVLHCALEMFEGEADIDLVREAERILKPGGKLVIIPLYMNEIHHIFRDPKTHRSPLPAIDEGAELVYRQDFYGIGFARFYSVEAFMKRTVKNITTLDLKIYRVINADAIHSKCYLNWVAVFEKRMTDD